ncbi:MAG TPA: molecular chaperone HtpG [Chthoniobacteraceae bacterium]|nr:molecular chaperone HtpG [Chthoniobacteraceae bacterium]
MSSTEKHTFQAEIAQLLDIVIHSLYTDKEIFIRELISNAADATEKLKFQQTSGQAVFQPEAELKISLATDEEGKTLTFTDAGIGMTHAELIENLGTIAHSGSKAFLEQIKASQKEGPVDANLIGQFGVGFYSAFMVADKVSVFTRSSQPGEEGWKWESDGKTGYEIEPAADLPRGTKIVLHLRDEAYAKETEVESIIKRYSNFVPFPIELNGKVVNTVQAIWTRSKNEVTEEEYNQFYEYVGHDAEAPLYRFHFNADAPLAIRSLLFVPSKSIETFGMGRAESEVHLYCRKVLIESKAKGLFPEWLRFLKGVVDSEDLPLNISRETMQDSALMQKLNRVLTGRFLKFLDEESRSDAEKYAKFFAEHGPCLKEGAVTDYEHREPLSKLLRFESSFTEKGKQTSFADYVSRMVEEQKEIYYILAPSREAAEASPFYEVLREKKFEALFLYDPRDEFVMDHLREFDGKPLKAAEKADLSLDQEATALSEEEATALAGFIKETLGERVHEVRASKRLVGSPAIAVESDKFMTSSMRRMMKALNRDSGGGGGAFESKPDLEINPNHSMIAQLEKMRHTDAALAAQVAEQIYDSARVTAGLLDDPREMLGRMNELLEKLLTK